MNSYLRGKYAELVARIYMRLQGFHIVARNYITGRGTNAGEIDFVAKRGKLLVFAEVKQRTTLDTAAYAISLQQRQRLIRGAKSFMAGNPQYAGCDVRFDAILIAFPLAVRHIPNAWTE